MKRILFYVLLLNVPNTFAQNGVGIGAGNIIVSSDAAVDMSKSTKGLLIPRLTPLGILFILAPAEGLILFDSTLHRTYQFQDGLWRYLVNNSSWTKSTFNKRHIFSLDSVGIGSTSPDARLEVNGNIRARSTMIVEDDVIVGGLLKGDDLTATGNIFIGGNAAVGGKIISQSSVVVDNTNPIVQLKNGGISKGFIQTSGDDFRFGTSSGNPTGKTIIRMDGTDIISIDTTSGFKVLIGGAGGNVSVVQKVTRLIGPDENMLPIFFGKVYGSGSQAWLSAEGTVINTSPGVYEIKTYSARFSGRATVLVTAAGTEPLIAAATNISESNAYNFKVQLFNPVTNIYTNGDFNFIVTDPINIFN